MDQINMHEAIDHDRRRFFGAAALTLTAAELGVIGAAHAETKPAAVPVIKAGTNTSFAPLKQIDAGVLNIGYAEAGPPNGPPVVLLHGWPYDIHDYIEVALMPEVQEKLIDSAHAEVGSRSIEQLEAERDEITVGFLELRNKRPVAKHGL
jgi:hypothetical protein